MLKSTLESEGIDNLFLIMNKYVLLAGVILALISCKSQGVSSFNKAPNSERQVVRSYEHPIPYSPRQYVCYHTKDSITIDGKIDEMAWFNVPWTDLFTDIKGDSKPEPELRTRAKMTWDESYFYIAGMMEETHVWATLKERDDIMYQDDDFEVYIDPDGDGNNYFVLAANAMNTIWDLYMQYPYDINDERNYIMNWDIPGVKTAVHVAGSINDPDDLDTYWSIEIAIPWACFKDFVPNYTLPEVGEQWRLNFSRVDWPVENFGDLYVKRKNMATGKRLPEHNWVWSAMGYSNMHKPELWGYLQFEKDRSQVFRAKEEEQIKWALWQTYYQIKECRSVKGQCSLREVTLPEIPIDGYDFSPEIFQDDYGFTLRVTTMDKRLLVVDERGRMVFM